MRKDSTVLTDTRNAVLGDLMAGALVGDQAAWSALVARLERVVWKAVNMATHDPEAREEAFAWTWMTLSTNLHAIRDPERLPGWLTTTAARRAVLLAKKNARTVSGVDLDSLSNARREWTESTSDEHVITDELCAVMRQAFWELDELCRELLTLLVLRDPPVPYAELERTMNRPHGWVGPTRARCLDKLRRTPTMKSLVAEEGFAR